ncbi:hypothetical protein BYT27DRAFT_7135629 [Phlegmacium glaucopus]|nr:hypothetical protein BYT27DRAFT_7135629 [Phlegmacium glaucopus]
MTTWIPRHDLALPNELLYSIISWVLVNSVHSICVSTGDVSWDKNVMNILCDVSPAFRGIAMEIVSKAFEISRATYDDEETRRLFATLQQIFEYLHQLGVRLRDPSEWGTVSFQVMDCLVSPYVFAYALYLSCISLRRHAGRSPRDVFEGTHQVVLSALAQSENLCKRVWPMEMTDLIRDKIQDEFRYARSGLIVVQSFHELNEYVESMIILHPSRKKDGTGPLAAVRSLIHNSLSKFEAVCGAYSCHVAGSTPSPDPRIYELPGVLSALRKAYTLTFEEDEYHLRERIQKLVDLWKDGCPFLNKGVDTGRSRINEIP